VKSSPIADAVVVVASAPPLSAVVVVSSLELEHAAAIIASTATNTSKRMERFALVIVSPLSVSYLVDADSNPRDRVDDPAGPRLEMVQRRCEMTSTDEQATNLPSSL
jgi:hypothetical protein